MFVEHKEAVEITEAPTKPTTLSGLIRYGSKLLPQGSGCYYLNGRTCAIGAAFHAEKGYPSAQMDIVTWLSKWNDLPIGTMNQIFEMNDSGESREQIADWLEAQGY